MPQGWWLHILPPLEGGPAVADFLLDGLSCRGNNNSCTPHANGHSDGADVMVVHHMMWSLLAVRSVLAASHPPLPLLLALCLSSLPLPLLFARCLSSLSLFVSPPRPLLLIPALPLIPPFASPHRPQPVDGCKARRWRRPSRNAYISETRWAVHPSAGPSLARFPAAFTHPLCPFTIFHNTLFTNPKP